MTPDIFTKYLDQPALLVSMPYQELKTLVVQYPYSQNLRLMLLLKSLLEKHKDKDRNLQLSATYSTNRDALYAMLQQVEDKMLLNPTQATHFLMEEDVLVLKDLSDVEHLLKKVPEYPTFTDITSENLFQKEIEPAREPYQNRVIEFDDLSPVNTAASPIAAEAQSAGSDFQMEETEQQDTYDLYIEETNPTKADASSDSLEEAVPTSPEASNRVAANAAEEEIPFEIYIAEQQVPDTIEKIALDLNVDDIFDEIERYNERKTVELPILPTLFANSISEEKIEAPAAAAPKVVVLPIIGISTPQKTTPLPFTPPTELPLRGKVLPIFIPEARSFYKEIAEQPIETDTSMDDFLASILENEPTKAIHIKKNHTFKTDLSLNESDEYAGGDDDFASETLAMLLEGQGATEKAMKMYEKLCLTFPEKSAYFAARIQYLKTKL
jgi:hypothetical protein